MLGEILAQAGDHGLLGFTFEYVVLQCEEGRCLHRVQDCGLELAVGVEEPLPDVSLCIVDHCLVSGGVTSGGGCHVAHHSGIDHPI